MTSVVAHLVEAGMVCPHCRKIDFPPSCRCDRIARGYFEAKLEVMRAGFSSDIVWAADLAKVRPDARYVMSEAAWVVLNSGFRYTVARKKWPALTEAFLKWWPQLISRSHLRVTAAGMEVFGHKQKIRAMVDIAHHIAEHGHQQIVADAAEPLKLTRLPFIGEITCWHLAKVLGVDVVKPDVHLQRAAAAAGFATPIDLCTAIRDATGDRLTVVDSVLWRYGEQMKARSLRGWADLFT